MKIRIVAAALVGLASLAATAPASAQVGDRAHRQEQRIQQGERSGALSPREAWQLQHQQRGIRWQEARMRDRNGGRLSPHDRWVLEHRQDAANRDIYHDKHNWHRG